MLLYILNATSYKKYDHLFLHSIGINWLFRLRTSLPLLQLMLLAIKAVQQLLEYIILSLINRGCLFSLQK